MSYRLEKLQASRRDSKLDARCLMLLASGLPWCKEVAALYQADEYARLAVWSIRTGRDILAYNYARQAAASYRKFSEMTEFRLDKGVGQD